MTRGRGKSSVEPTERLDTGLLVETDDAVVAVKRFSVRDSLVQVEDASGLRTKLRVPRMLPVVMRPRSEGELVEDAVDGGAARGGVEFLRHLSGEVREGVAAEREAAGGRGLTGDGEYGDPDLMGVEASSSGTREIAESIEPGLGEPSAPGTGGVLGATEPTGDGRGAPSPMREKDDTGPEDRALGSGGLSGGVGKGAELIAGQGQHRRGLFGPS
jgi:hypothetical protein